ncbi:MAG: hypothetical protein ACTSRK_21395 [Promethearchaeota archaeon]
MRISSILLPVLSALLFLVILVEYRILGIVLIVLWIIGVYARWAHSKNRKLRATLRAIESQLKPLAGLERQFKVLVEMTKVYIKNKEREEQRDHPAMGSTFGIGAQEFSPVEEG